jgi:hypothetical protein
MMDVKLLIVIFAAVSAIWGLLIALARPRLLTYILFALSPTQYIFIPVSTFFISPADLLVCAAAAGFVLRIAAGERRPLFALVQHRYYWLMMFSYVVGFVVLGVFSRTFIRVPLGIVPSLLACETLRTRRQLTRAATALVIAGALDAAYGLYFILRGTPLHATRFSGMSDVNFSAMLIAVATAVSLTQIGAVRRAAALLRPSALGGLVLATLSQMGVLALVAAWFAVLRHTVSRINKRRLALAGLAVVAVALASPAVRERILNRNVREVQADGVERNSTDVRLSILRTAARTWVENPTFGVGYFKFVEHSTSDPEIDSATFGEGYPTHNTYLEVLVEGGIVAFACFLLHLGLFGLPTPRAIHASIRNRDRIVAASLVGVPVVLVCAALANVLLVYSFWCVCGLAMACLNMLRAERRPLGHTSAMAGV